LRLEQIEVEPGVTRRIRNQICTLFARHCLQLAIEELQHVCLRQLARRAAVGLPQALLTPADRGEHDHDRQVEREEVPGHVQASVENR
jgi:hypothetical protein